MTCNRVFCAVVLFCLALGLSRSAEAHRRSISTSSWTLGTQVPAEATIEVRARWIDLQRVVPGLPRDGRRALIRRPSLARAVDAYLVDHVALLADGVACAAAAPPRPLRSLDPEHLGRTWQVRCTNPGAMQLRVDLFFGESPAHLHLARVQIGDAPPFERIFAAGTRELLVENAGSERFAKPSEGSFRDFVLLGLEHIASGTDHLAFLLALLLVGTTVGGVTRLVTGFTVAHSITLALGVLGVVQPVPAAVESLIGLSIAVVALENFALTAGVGTRRGILIGLVLATTASVLAALGGLLVVPPLALLGVGLFSACTLGLHAHVARPERLRWYMAFVFGLIHGFGFAGILAQLGLPPDRVASSLLGFNLGVEIGQVGIVVAAWPILRLILGPANSAPPRAAGATAGRPARIQLGSTPVLAAGLFWYLSRALP